MQPRPISAINIYLCGSIDDSMAAKLFALESFTVHRNSTITATLLQQAEWLAGQASSSSFSPTPTYSMTDRQHHIISKAFIKL